MQLCVCGVKVTVVAELPTTPDLVPPGRHCVLDAFGCDVDALRDHNGIIAALRTAADRAGVRVLDITSHRFPEPGGVTAVALLAESHLSIHTWPEHGYAAVDAFTCGAADPAVACAFIADSLGAHNCRQRTIDRGAAP